MGLKKHWHTIALIGIILALAFFGMNRNEYADSQRIEKEQAKKRLKVVRDSVVKVIQRKDLELLKAMLESAEADMLAKESVQQAEKYRKKYESVKFIRHDSDSARSAAISATLKKAGLRN